MHIYEVLRRPIVTEKTMVTVDTANQYAFEVDTRANKFQVKDAVETAFDVTVERVNIMVMPAKTTRRQSHPNSQAQVEEGGCHDWRRATASSFLKASRRS